jgi:hypothetical protein
MTRKPPSTPALNIILANLDTTARQKISSLIYETVRAAPGMYEIPALCQIVATKSIYNSTAVHYVVDDQLDFGDLTLDKFNRLYSFAEPPQPARVITDPFGHCNDSAETP